MITHLMGSLRSLGKVFICVCTIQVMVLAKGDFNKTVQKILPSCDLSQPCPHVSFQDVSEWQQRQRSCCYLRSGLLFHCQYQKNGQRPVVACLPSNTCSAGTYAKQFTESMGNRTSAWVECLPCNSTHYEEQEKPTYMFSYDRCSNEKLVCKKTFGETLCTEGGPQADDKCRCLYEDGYAPFPDNESCLCFNKTANCECRQKNCSLDEELNEDYQCVQKLFTAMTNRSSTASQGSHLRGKTTPVTKAAIEKWLVPQLRKEFVWETDESFSPAWISAIIIFIVMAIICGTYFASCKRCSR